MTTITQLASGASVYARSAHVPLQSFDINRPSVLPGSLDRSAEDWASTIDELLRIRNFSDNWDGEGTEAPHPALVDGAITLAKSFRFQGVSPPDRVHASVNGTVYFEWHTPVRYYEIEVVSPTRAECRVVRKGSDAIEEVQLLRW
jgi:hypothetical protein